MAAMKPPGPKSDLIGLAAILVTIIIGIAAWFEPEFRQFFGLSTAAQSSVPIANGPLDNKNQLPRTPPKPKRAQSSRAVNPKSDVQGSHFSPPLPSSIGRVDQARDVASHIPQSASTSPANQASNVAANAPTATQAVAPPGIFETESYRLKADSLHKRGSYASMSLSLECVADKPTRFVMALCYLLDENGSRWNQQGGLSNGFTWGGEIIPGTKVAINLTFATATANSGTDFTFICTEGHPQTNRRIVLGGIPAQ